MVFAMQPYATTDPASTGSNALRSSVSLKAHMVVMTVARSMPATLGNAAAGGPQTGA